MTYKNNEINFSLTSPYTLICGKFTVKEFSVSSGEDPDKKIYQGATFDCSSTGTFTFSVGNDLTTDVADWFNERVSPEQTTFNHSAGKLYFALLGTLELTLTGGIIGWSVETYTFDNVVLAKGLSTLSDNWWFGGENCEYIGDNQVMATGTDKYKMPVSFIFQRGDNTVNAVETTPSTLYETANWLGALDDTLSLNQIMMPGSHDAGMSALAHCAPPLFSPPFTKTQKLSIGNQLIAGSRYFDIRIDYDHDALVTYHRSGQWGCNGQSLQETMEEVKNFLILNPSEMAILKFSHIRDDGSHDASDIKERIEEFINDYSSLFYKNNDPETTLMTLPLGKVRGKMILTFDYNEFISPTTGRFHHDKNLNIYDSYSNSDDYETMKNDQLEKWEIWQDIYGNRTEQFFLLSWTLTAQGVNSPSINSMAEVANGMLTNVLSEEIINNGRNKPHIVYVDFIDKSVAQTIIRYNFI